MKVTTFQYLLFLLLILLPSAAEAQRKSAELTAIEERLVQSFEEDKPTWKHEAGKPIEGSGDIAIHHWMGADGGAGVTIVRYASNEEAQKHIRQFAHDMRANSREPESADEAYSMQDASKSITVRKQQFILYIYVLPRNPSDREVMLKEISKLALKAIK